MNVYANCQNLNFIKNILNLNFRFGGLQSMTSLDSVLLGIIELDIPEVFADSLIFRGFFSLVDPELSGKFTT